MWLLTLILVKWSDGTGSFLCAVQTAETWRRTGRRTTREVVAAKVRETDVVWLHWCQNWGCHR